MLKDILNLEGAAQLSTNEQKKTLGGHNCMNDSRFCYYQCGGCNKGWLNSQGNCICK